VDLYDVTEVDTIAPYLIIGYGNTLRSDDAAGQHVAEIAAGWQLSNVRSLAVHQLTPELAEPLSSAQLAIFVDVYVANETQTGVQIIELMPSLASEQPSSLGHTADPRSLLLLAQQVYGTAPPSWWILVPAVNFEFGEQFSCVTQQGITAAIAQIQHLLSNDSSSQAEPTM
jgi:hydrogenase maturation protease